MEWLRRGVDNGVVKEGCGQWSGQGGITVNSLYRRSAVEKGWSKGSVAVVSHLPLPPTHLVDLHYRGDDVFDEGVGGMEAGVDG